MIHVMKDMHGFAKRLREARERAGFTLTDAAYKIGLDLAQLDEAEQARGAGIAVNRKISDIADAYMVSPSWLVNGPGAP